MAAEDYDDVPGFGGSQWSSHAVKPRAYKCNNCHQPITFSNRKPFNVDGTPHRCMGKNARPGKVEPEKATDNHAATLFALSAMNAIINSQIQAFGGDHIHRMNFHDVADASWQAAVAMLRAERNYRDEIAASQDQL